MLTRRITCGALMLLAGSVVLADEPYGALQPIATSQPAPVNAQAYWSGVRVAAGAEVQGCAPGAPCAGARSEGPTCGAPSCDCAAPLACSNGCCTPKTTVSAEYLYYILKDSPIPFPIATSGPNGCLLYTSPSPRDRQKSRMPSSA